MKRKHNYPKHVLQWGVLTALVVTVLWAALGDKPVDVEKYCPFGGLQAFGTYLVNHSLACSMSMLQIMMGLVLAAGVILFSKLFCGYLCPLGTVGEAMGRAGKRMRVQFDIPSGGIAAMFDAAPCWMPGAGWWGLPSTATASRWPATCGSTPTWPGPSAWISAM